MFSIDATGGQTPVVGLPEPPRKTDGPAHVIKAPPALAETPGQAAPPPQAGEDADAARARMDQAERMVERLNREFARHNARSSRRVRFLLDPGTRELIVQVIDGDTEQVVRQLPPQEALQRLKALDLPKGSLVDGAV
jgi:flagellar protein FlaG